MKYTLTILSLILALATQIYAQLPMGGWQMHNSYGNVTRVEASRNLVYALSRGSLMSVSKEDGQIEYYNKLLNLSSSNIAQICYDAHYGKLIITYLDGNIDLLDDNGNVENIRDRYSSQTRENKTVNDVVTDGKEAYLATNFGILALDLRRKELKETFIIGEDASSVSVKHLAITDDTLYAVSDKKLYSAALASSMIDYHNWNVTELPGKGNIAGLQVLERLYLLRDSVIYMRTGDGWQTCLPEQRFGVIRSVAGQLAALNMEAGLTLIDNGKIKTVIPYFLNASDVVFDQAAHKYWFAYGAEGVGELDALTFKWNKYQPNGPVSSVPYRLRMTGNRLYMVPGGYWATKNNNPPQAMFYENGEWTNYTTDYFDKTLGHAGSDYSDMLGDPADPSHFFIAAFSIGLLEFRDNKFYKLYTRDNAPFILAANNALLYTWVDGLVFDNEGNLYVGNVDAGLCMLSPSGEWTLFKNSATVGRNRIQQVLISNKNPNIIYLTNARSGAGIGVMDTGGTLKNQSDDRAVFRHEFEDQNGKTVLPEYVYCAAQDLSGEVWVGTSKGLFIIPDLENMFSSNACKRIIIQRTDGSGLADYILGEERINAIAVDGANRKWIGTQGSGLYLMSADGTETIEHFTTHNSPLPDNTVISLAIEHESGVVYIGTGVGLVSYQSNAADAHTDFSDVYAYPNPVRGNFEGVVTISGLMENSKVKITDSAGQLVAEAVSLGSLATWDCKDGAGKRVATGVYMAQCVSSDGSQYALVKILVVN